MMRCFIIFLLAAVSAIAQAPPDLIIVNASVRTMNKANPVAEAVAIRNGRIVAVGSSQEIRELAVDATRIIDAKGRLVLPGFNDAHAHLIAIGNGFSSLDLSSAKTPDEVLERIRHFAKFLPNGRWVLGAKLNPALDLSSTNIDSITPNNPLFVYHLDAKSALANSAALKLARVDGDQVVREARLQAVQRVVPNGHVRDLPAIIQTATNYAASLGVTSLQDMHSDDLAAVLRQLDSEGKLKTRVYDCVSIANWAKLAAVGVKAASGDDMVRTGCVKGHYDEEDEATGSLAKNIAGADSAGLQVMVHAIGPKANQLVLSAMETAAKSNGPKDRRFRVEHVNGVRPVDVARFGRAKIIPSMQPALFYSEGSGTTDDYRRLIDSGAPLAFGADAPMRGFSPLEGIYAAVNAGGKRGISVEEAVYAYTMGAAFAEFQEKEKGSIEVGKVADLVILSSDIFAEKDDIRSASVVMTFVNGRLVFQNNN